MRCGPETLRPAITAPSRPRIGAATHARPIASSSCSVAYPRRRTPARHTRKAATVPMVVAV